MKGVSDELILNGKTYISARKAAEVSGYTADYIGQLARADVLPSTLVGRARFVERAALAHYVKVQKGTSPSVENESPQENLQEEPKEEPQEEKSTLRYESDERPLRPEPLKERSEGEFKNVFHKSDTAKQEKTTTLLALRIPTLPVVAVVLFLVLAFGWKALSAGALGSYMSALPFVESSVEYEKKDAGAALLSRDDEEETNEKDIEEAEEMEGVVAMFADGVIQGVAGPVLFVYGGMGDTLSVLAQVGRSFSGVSIHSKNVVASAVAEATHSFFSKADLLTDEKHVQVSTGTPLEGLSAWNEESEVNESVSTTNKKSLKTVFGEGGVRVWESMTLLSENIMNTGLRLRTGITRAWSTVGTTFSSASDGTLVANVADSVADAFNDTAFSFYTTLHDFFWSTSSTEIVQEENIEEKENETTAEPEPRIIETVREVVVERPVTRVERIVEQVPVALSGVTDEELQAALDSLNNSLRSEIYRIYDGLSQSNTIRTIHQTIAQTNNIDQLNGVTINDATVNSISGLTDGDIPNDITASNYLPLTGGTLTGALTGTDATFTGSFTVSGTQTVSGALTVPYLIATSTTATSTFAGAVGIGTTSPAVSLAIDGTDALGIPSGTTAQRPSKPLTGYLRYNTTTSGFEGYSGSTWSGLGGVIDVDGDTYILAESSSGADEDVLFFTTAGSERARISATGNLGIGTTSPYAKLSVEQNAGEIGFAVGSSTATNFIVDKNGYVGIGTANPLSSGGRLTIYENNANTAALPQLLIEQDGSGDASLGFLLTGIRKWQVGVDNSDSDAFKISRADSGTWVQTSLTIDNTGRVGIGAVDSISGLFEIDTPSGSTDPAIVIDYEGASNGGGIGWFQGSTQVGTFEQVNEGSGIYHFSLKSWDTSSNVERLRLEGDTGNIGIGTTSPFAKLSVEQNAGEIGFAVGSSTATNFIVDASGNVGIGTANPSYSLDTTGSIRVSSGSVSAPGIVFQGANAGTGIYQLSEQLFFTRAGENKFTVNNSGAGVTTSFGGFLVGEISSPVNPTLIPNQTDFNTGIGAGSGGSGDDTLHLITGGVNRIKIDSNGFVGIGTTSPFAKLSVEQNAGEIGFAVGSSTKTSFIVDKSGRVGIGTSTPDVKLDVFGNDTTNNTVKFGTFGIQSFADGNGFIQTNGYFDGTNGIRITDNPIGMLQFTQQTPYGRIQLRQAQNGTAGGIATLKTRLRIDENGNSIFNFDNEDVDFSVRGDINNDVFYVDGGNERVGIGTTSPFARLSVTHEAGEVPFAVGSSTATSFIVHGDGRVGIASAETPSGDLHIRGGGDLILDSGDGVSAVSFLHDGSGSALIRSSSTAGLALYSNVSSGRGIIMNDSGVAINDLSPDGTHFEVSADGTFGGAALWISSDDDANGDLFTVLELGFVGIGTTTPWNTLSVAGGVNFSSTLTSGSTGNYLCINTTTYEVTSGTTCSASSRRFKDNIQTLTYGLDAINQLQPISFNYKKEFNPDTSTRIGFIAEDVAAVIPELVVYGKDGQTEAVVYENLTAVLAGGIQELDVKVEALRAVEDETFFEALLARLAQAMLRVKHLVVDDELCIGSTCVTEAQLQNLLAGSAGGASVSTTSSDGGADTTPPVITVNGNNPAEVLLGSSYSDLGAYAVDDVDGERFVDSEGTVDVETVGEYTITYSSYDVSGNTATATRTVYVIDGNEATSSTTSTSTPTTPPDETVTPPDETTTATTTEETSSDPISPAPAEETATTEEVPPEPSSPDLTTETEPTPSEAISDDSTATTTSEL